MPDSFAQLQTLLDEPGLAALGPARRPSTKSAGELRKAASSWGASRQASTRTQDLVLGTLLLWHDHLEEAHEIGQEIEDPDGSLLHAIMHRREPDSSNSKYWWRRVGNHPCFAALAKKVSAHLAPQHPQLHGQLVRESRWDPYVFVDLCEAARREGDPARQRLMQEVQRLEIETFLQHLVSKT